MMTGGQVTVDRMIATAIVRDKLEATNLIFQLETNYDLIDIAERVNRTLGTYRNRLRYISSARPYLKQLPKLVKYISQAFSHNVPATSSASFFIDILNRMCIDDFNSILIMCLNGQGNGAIQLIPSMYERLVTSIFLDKHPDQFPDFFEFCKKTLDSDRRTLDEVPIWKPIKQLAADTDLAVDFHNAYVLPQYFRHPTTVAITSKVSETQNTASKPLAESEDLRVKLSLPLAHWLAVRVVMLQVKHFQLIEDPGFQALINNYTVLIRSNSEGD
jgi:hypothetical protein